MAISYKTIYRIFYLYSLGFHNLFVNIISILDTRLYQRPVESCKRVSGSGSTIAVALNLERLYNKTSDFGIDYEKAVKYSPILINVRCTMHM